MGSPFPVLPGPLLLPCRALLVSQAGGWSSWAPDGSRHPCKLLPPLQRGATRSWQQMEGPQQHRELHRQQTGREPACPWSGGSPGAAPRCHPAPITPFPSAPDAHPSLPPTFAQPESSKMPWSLSCWCQDTLHRQPHGTGPAALTPASSALVTQCRSHTDHTAWA